MSLSAHIGHDTDKPAYNTQSNFDSIELHLSIDDECHVLFNDIAYLLFKGYTTAIR